MTPSDQATLAAEYPFASLLRASDRERILVQVMASVWDSILQLPVLPRERHDGSEGEPGDLPLVVGTIRIAGDWDGVVAMTCPRAFAAKCTAIMHGRQAEELTDGETRDGWGELVNMVGGNLKALVPPVSRLGLPEVRDAEVFAYAESGGRVVNALTFACLGHRVRLTVSRPNH